MCALFVSPRVFGLIFGVWRVVGSSDLGALFASLQIFELVIGVWGSRGRLTFLPFSLHCDSLDSPLVFGGVPGSFDLGSLFGSL